MITFKKNNQHWWWWEFSYAYTTLIYWNYLIEGIITYKHSQRHNGNDNLILIVTKTRDKQQIQLILSTCLLVQLFIIIICFFINESNEYLLHICITCSFSFIYIKEIASRILLFFITHIIIYPLLLVSWISRMKMKWKEIILQ